MRRDPLPSSSPSPEQPDQSSSEVVRTRERLLIEQVRNGDGRAFAELVSQHISRLTRFARYLLGSDDTAEDCVQSVFVHLWEHRQRLDPDRPLRPYLLRAVQNRVISERRAEGVRGKYRDAQLLTASEHTAVPNPEDAILTGAMIQNAIQQLPERRQLALRLWLSEGLTDPEIADVLGISLQATDRLIRRALADVRDILVVSKK
jgi:RNA polymerase sigma-70 factor (ECF subfamily)